MENLLKVGVIVAVIRIENKCVKMLLPNKKVVDILPEIFGEIKKWLQTSKDAPESGGYIIGYQHGKTKNISLEGVSHPYLLDIRNRFRFDIKDPRHNIFLMKAKLRKSYYMGVWHTHPQVMPEPSSIDWNDWYKTLDIDQTACEYAFFIIAGTTYIRVWVGDFQSKSINEIYECEKVGDLYKKV